MDHQAGAETQRPQPITVAFTTLEGPVSGTVSVAGRKPEPFHGWLELMDELERLRAAPAPDPVGRAS